MSSVFISYRRADASGYAGRLYDQLSQHFGEEQVFRDIDRIEPGRDFIEAIDQSIASCDVLLVIIGSQWLTIADEDGRRLQHPEDFVRLEVAKALARGVPVIPVLIPGADSMPEAKDLPEDLAKLSRRQAIKVRDETWSHDVERLTNALERTGVPPKPRRRSSVTPPPPAPAPRQSKKPWVVAGAVGLTIVVSLVASGAFENGDGGEHQVFAAQEQALVAAPQENLPQAVQEPTAEADDQALLAQSLLTTLQYDPGPIDGKPGGQTRRAVQAFERDQGLSATGQIDEELLEQLRGAVAAGEVAPARPQPVADRPTSNQRSGDFSGSWYDDTGALYKLRQSGRTVRGSGYDPGSGNTAAIMTFEGSVASSVLNYTYVTVFGETGVGRGALEPDGQHMTVVVTDSSGTMSYGRLHLGHTP